MGASHERYLDLREVCIVWRQESWGEAGQRGKLRGEAGKGRGDQIAKLDNSMPGCGAGASHADS